METLVDDSIMDILKLLPRSDAVNLLMTNHYFYKLDDQYWKYQCENSNLLLKYKPYKVVCQIYDLLLDMRAIIKK